MADETKEEQEPKASIVNVADMHVSTIIAALHQNALDKCGAESKNIKILNSAIDDKDGKASINSAGEHIVSAIPLKEGEKIQKKDAVEVLKKYVQWFVGPDLAKKVDNNTVVPLTQSPMNESHKKFMSFKKYLIEAEGEGKEEDKAAEVAASAKEVGDASEGASAEGGEEAEKKPEENAAEGKEEDEKNDESKESDVGYYITYKLEVEGLPQKALKDSTKKFRKTFFDNLTITASGLFGGSSSFTVGDIKKSFRDAFGPIDPDELVQNVRQRIEKIFKGSDTPYIQIQDKNTMISDLGDQINGSQKKQISSANYSLFIRVTEDDPKKPLLNPRTVADIVQSSIKGLFKKFKNTITKNDVVYIPEYKDTHGSAQKVRELYNNVPDPDTIFSLIDKAQNANDAWRSVERELDRKINKHPEKNNCKRAVECLTAWENFKAERNKAKDTPEMRSSYLRGKPTKDYFKSFTDTYKKAYERTRDKSVDRTINESCNESQFVIPFYHIDDTVHKLLLEEFLGEEGEDASPAKADDASEPTTGEIKDAVIKELDVYKTQYEAFGDYANKDKVIVAGKDVIVGKLKKHYDIKPDIFTEEPKDDAAGDKDSKEKIEYKNAILLCAHENTLLESVIKDSSIKNDIMSILFEDDKQTNKTFRLDVNKLHQCLAGALKDFNIDDYASKVFEIPFISLNESMLTEGVLADYIDRKGWSKEEALNNINDIRDNVKNKNGKTQNIEHLKQQITSHFISKDKNASSYAYVLPFGKNEYQQSDEATTDGDADANKQGNYDTVGRYDAYVIPIKGLASEDPEYANTNI